MPDDQFEELAGREPARLVNIGCGQDVTIRELAENIADVVGFTGDDTSKPDSTAQKLLDCSRLNSLGWEPTIPRLSVCGRSDGLPALVRVPPPHPMESLISQDHRGEENFAQ